VGDPSDPMTENRAQVFKPLGVELAKGIESLAGTVPASEAASPLSRPVEPREVIESRLILCDRCGTPVALLVFTPQGRSYSTAPRSLLPPRPRSELRSGYGSRRSFVTVRKQIFNSNT